MADLAWQAIQWLSKIESYKKTAEAAGGPGDPGFDQAKAAAADYYNKLRSNGFGGLADRAQASNAAQLLTYINSDALTDAVAAAGLPTGSWVRPDDQTAAFQAALAQSAATTAATNWGSPVQTPATVGSLLGAIAQAIAAPGAWFSEQINAVGPFVRYLVPAVIGIAAIKAFGKVFRINAAFGRR